jgi:phage shock protein PspC (stress-responsive transcriptional regulator)
MFCTNCGTETRDIDKFCSQCGKPTPLGEATCPRAAHPQQKLHRSTNGKMLGGVCAGLAEYFDLDATLMRLLMVLAAIFSGGLVFIAYLLSWMIMPLERPAAPPPFPAGFAAS